MGCLGGREEKGEVEEQQKWDYIVSPNMRGDNYCIVRSRRSGDERTQVTYLLDAQASYSVLGSHSTLRYSSQHPVRRITSTNTLDRLSPTLEADLAAQSSPTSGCGYSSS